MNASNPWAGVCAASPVFHECHLLNSIKARRSDLLHHGVLVLEALRKLLPNQLYCAPHRGQLHCQVLQNRDDGEAHAPLPQQHQGQDLQRHQVTYST